MTTQQFKATITRSGSRTFILLPFDPNSVWGARQRYYITGTVNGHKIRGPLGSEGSQYFLSLGDAWRRDTGLNDGAEADVILTPEGPQADSLSPDIADALASEPVAKAFFEALATFYRKNYIRWIEDAKRPETRAARIHEMVALLKDGKRQR